MVAVHHAPGRLDLTVRAPATVLNAARDLAGVAERVALYDGSLRLASEEEFLLEARLPVGIPALR